MTDYQPRPVDEDTIQFAALDGGPGPETADPIPDNYRGKHRAYTNVRGIRGYTGTHRRRRG